MNFTSSGTQGEFTVFFKDPSTVAVGTYSDTIQIGLCTDASCSHSVAGTLVTVAITYVVTVDATATLTADPVTVGAGLPATLTWSSTHASACVASGDWSGTLAGSGSMQVTPTQLGAHVYTISCSDPGAS